MSARLWAEPEPVLVTCDEQGRPLAFRWGGELHQVERICNRWRVSGRWWRGSGEGWDYIKLTTTSGLLCLLACEVGQDAWRLVRLYD